MSATARSSTALIVAILMSVGIGRAGFASTATAVRGGYIEGVPCIFTAFTPEANQLTTGTFTCTAATGVATADRSEGSLHFSERFSIDEATNTVPVVATIVGSAGDFAGSTGSVTFDGIQASGTIGHGGYSGSWMRP